ncbi:GDSL-like Lipase/Acylhydrolase family protein [Pseudonocardia thermophila]|uniref:GDSL-like Lipase/Acylhydrolase family protein n=1 Tax=Pseudonocardia thermophila TaxID=1848 RepID=A0A1M6N7G5_PSETH|nr:GDSL-like Lipase/Acylhydrolase family protein [Pseudonocardia thermophila]
MIGLLTTVLLVPAAVADPGASAAPAARPPAVVVLGDSAAAGDGAGDYEPGTRGEDGNWCHRSPHAYAHRTGLPGTSINLACSGADTGDVAFPAPGHYTEPSQARRLAEIARQYRVHTVVLQVGANDEGSLTQIGKDCVRTFIDPVQPACRTTIGPYLGERTAAAAAGIERAARDVREAMRRAGYGTTDYALVLTSYAPPVTGKMISVPIAIGCPFSRPDAEWGHDVLFPAFSDAVRGVAQRVGAQFLGLDLATDGHEACTSTDPAAEWHRRITVDPHAFVHGGLDAFGWHLAQESFHPTAAAHERIGACVGEIVRAGVAAAECVTGADGVTRLVTAGTERPAAA